jgi:tetratricopeptide (TPR) repeat protein
MLDRGLYEQASPHLDKARRLWRSTGERAGTAYATALLGRLASRTGRHEEALALLREATAELRSLGEQGYAEFAEALLAEAEAFGGDPDAALSVAHRLIPTADRTLPLLHRVIAIARTRLQRGGAWEHVETSIAVARERDALYDLAAALDLSELTSEPDVERARERDEILTRLGVERLPTPSLGIGVEAPAAA